MKRRPFRRSVPKPLILTSQPLPISAFPCYALTASGFPLRRVSLQAGGMRVFVDGLDEPVAGSYHPLTIGILRSYFEQANETRRGPGWQHWWASV